MMTTGIQERDDETGPARLAPVVSGPPGLGDPVLLGDVVALIVSDLSVTRKGAPPYQWKAEQIQHPIRAASRRSR